MMKRTSLSPDAGPFHFIGVGGIGMSGIAEMLLAEGLAVQGSDLKGNAQTERLAAKGATIFEGQRAANLAGAGTVVVSTAIRPDNPELAEARRLGLPVVHRSQMLAELMRNSPAVAVAGTHGKTTTTTLVAAMLEAGGFDPGVINGGVIHAYGSNAKAGSGEWMVVEADESDGSFNRLPASVGIVTNIDPEHMEHWQSFDALRGGFVRFLAALPTDGCAILCLDHAEVAALVDLPRAAPSITYGLKPGAMLVAEGARFENGKARFDIRVNLPGEDRIIESCELPMPGLHNVSNALAAVAVGLHLGMSDAAIRAALAGFEGVGRRFTRVGEVGGITVIDDYGHHPVEIAATLAAARQAVGEGARVIAVHQPHRYTRLHALFDDFATCFDSADAVGLLPLYTAGEDPIAGASSEALAAAMASRGGPPVRLLPDEAALADLVRAHAGPGDMVVCLGAGTISAWARALPARLAEGNAA